jgi:hypothetical protein
MRFSQLAPPSPPGYVTWQESALGRVAVAGTPLEQVNFTEYDSELLVYSREITSAELTAMAAAAATGAAAKPGAGLSAERGAGAGAAAAGGVVDAMKAVPLVLLSGVGNAYTVFLNGKKAAVGWESGHHGGTVLLGKNNERKPTLIFVHFCVYK